MRKHSDNSLDALLQKDGLHFLQSAYEVLLSRPLDPGGQRTYSAALRAGFSKTYVLYSIVNSPEGRRLGLALPGLARRYWTERLLPPAIIRRALGLRVPDPAMALLLAEFDALRAHIAHEAQSSAARASSQLQSGAVTPSQALDLAHMLRAAIARLEGAVNDLAAAHAATPAAPRRRADAGTVVLKLGSHSDGL